MQAAEAPSIVVQPVDKGSPVGSNVTFAVTASGTPTLYYQWRFNSNNIPGATNNTLPLMSVSFAQTGNYAVVVSNAVGSVTSSNVSLAVFLLPPAGLTNWWAGESNVLDRVGTNNGTLINGASFTNGWVGKAFNFDGVDDYVDVGGLPFLQGSLELTVMAWVKKRNENNGKAGFVGLWDDKSAASTSSFILYNGTQDKGEFAIALDNDTYGEVGGNAKITVNQWTHLAGTWRSSDGALRFYMNGVEHETETVGPGRTLKNVPSLTAKIGEWGVVRDSDYKMSGQIDEVAIFARALTAGEIQAIFAAGSAGMASTPVIQSGPLAQALFPGQQALFNVSASGSFPLFYQWRFNGSPLSGATNSSLNLNDVQPSNIGSYSVVVSNHFGAVASSGASLSLHPPPSINNPPQSSALSAGGSTTLSVTATGVGPLSYQWFLNGVSLPGASSATLAVTNMTTAQAGDYYVEVSNPAGLASSSLARLTLNADPAWVARVNGAFDSNDGAQAIAVDAEGNVYVAGFSVGASSGTDFLTVKYSPSGTELWSRPYNGPVSGSDFATAIALDSLGNAYVTGESRGTNGNPDFATIKYDPTGNLQWVARYNSPANGNDSAIKVAVDGAGNVLVLGNSDSDYATVKYSTDGQQLWAARYDGPANNSDVASDLAVDGTGNVYVTGGAVRPGTSRDFTTIKYNPSGTPLWVAHYTSPGNVLDVARAIALDGSGNVYVSGGAMGNGSTENIVTVKYDSLGQELWVRTVNGSADNQDRAVDMTLDSSGRVVIAGWVTGRTTEEDWVLVHYDADGGIRWSDSSNQPGQDLAAALTTDLAGNIYATGLVTTNSQTDYLTVKMDSEGNVLWTIRYDNGGNDETRGIALAADGGVIVTGVSERAGGTGTDFATVRYTQLGWPMIISSPPSQTVPLHSPLNLQVLATGSGPITYQWKKDGTALPGATNSSLVFSDTLAIDAGSYSVLVRNPVGGVQANPAELTVGPEQLPMILQELSSATVSGGDSILLSPGYTGSGPLRFQWRLNGINVAGATNDTLTLSNFQIPNAGSYSLAIENHLGTAATQPAQITLNFLGLPLADDFLGQIVRTDFAGAGRASNTNATLEPGEPLHLGKLGGSSVWITWQAPADGIASFQTQGSTFDTLLAVYTGDSLTNLSLIAGDDDRGGFLTSSLSFNAVGGMLYRVVVLGAGDGVGEILLSWDLELTAEELPTILTHPLSQTVAEGDSVHFDVVAIGAGLSYQWLYLGEPIPGATSSSFTIPTVMQEHVGQYTVRVTGGGRVTDAEPADLQLNLTGTQVENVRVFDKFFDVIGANLPLRLGDVAEGGGRVRLAGLSRGYSGAQVFHGGTGGKEPGEPNHCGRAGGASSWFSYQAEHDGSLSVNTDGSTFDTVLSVYTGTGTSLSTLIAVACDDNSGLDGVDSSVTFDVVKGTFYFIAIDGVNGAKGITKVNFSLATPATLAAMGKTIEGENRVRIVGQSDGSFQLLYSTNLFDWVLLLTTNLGAGSMEFIHDGSTNSVDRFYRALTLP